jgi:hypothetical protein
MSSEESPLGLSSSCGVALLKCPRMGFLWVSAIMTFGNPAAISGVELCAATRH